MRCGEELASSDDVGPPGSDPCAIRMPIPISRLVSISAADDVVLYQLFRSTNLDKKNARTFLRLGGEAALQSPSDKDPKAREEVGNSRVRESSTLDGFDMRLFRCGINGIYAAVRQIS